MIRRRFVPCIILVLIITLVLPVHGQVPAGSTDDDSRGFTLSAWVMVPVSDITTHLREGQDILSILVPFLAVLILGALLIVRREGKKGVPHRPAFWLATVAGLCYLGGAAVTMIQIFRARGITGFSSGIVIILVFAVLGVILGTAALRLTRTQEPWPLKTRISFMVIAVLGILFWSGLLIGPVLTLIAAVLPDRGPAITESR